MDDGTHHSKESAGESILLNGQVLDHKKNKTLNLTMAQNGIKSSSSKNNCNVAEVSSTSTSTATLASNQH